MARDMQVQFADFEWWVCSLWCFLVQTGILFSVIFDSLSKGPALLSFFSFSETEVTWHRLKPYPSNPCFELISARNTAAQSVALVCGLTTNTARCAHSRTVEIISGSDNP